MKASIAILLIMSANLAFASSQGKISVDEMKLQLQKDFFNCTNTNDFFCGRNISSLNNNSSCEELRNFLKNSGLVAINPKTGTETDVSNVVWCEEK